MLGAAGTVYASLPWLSLVMLALIPLAVHIPIRHDSALWMQYLKLCIAAFIPVAAAIGYVAQQSPQGGY